MRAIALFVATAALAGRAWAAAPSLSTVAVYWEPPGKPRLGASVRAAFAEAVRPMQARLVDATAAAIPQPSLAPMLEAAKGDHARFAFAEAIARLDELERTAEARGGGDLDGRQLSEIFLYRGLCKLETSQSEAAWDDLVRAARLDPARIMDPAHYPPRAVSAYTRAVAEVAKLPRARLGLGLPAGASLRVDGGPIAAQIAGGDAPSIALTLGAHLVMVSAEGFEPWAGVETVTGERQRFSPSLRPLRAPDPDRLLAAPGVAAGTSTPGRLIIGALERTEAGWRFVLRDEQLVDGRFVGEAVALGDGPAGPQVEALAARVLPSATAPATGTAATTATAKRAAHRVWPWVLGGVLAAGATTGITLGVVYGQAAPGGSIGGSFGPL